VATAIIIIAASALLAVRFQQSADGARQEQVTFAGLAERSHEMNALEWQAIAEHGVNQELATAIERARQDTNSSLDQLPIENGKYDGLKQLGARYLAALDNELSLLVAGDMEGAVRATAEVTAPAFQTYHAELAQEVTEHDDEAGQAATSAKVGSGLALAVAVIVMGSLLWAWARSRRAVALRRLEDNALQRQASIFAALNDGIIIRDTEGRMVDVNHSAEKILGLSRRQLMNGARGDSTAGVEAITTLSGRMLDSVKSDGRWSGELEFVRQNDGAKLTGEVVIVPMCDHGDVATGTVSVIRDVTGRKAAEEEIRHLAYYDTLTGLPNRALFQDRLSQAMAQAQRHGQPFTLMSLDVDRLKVVNDTMGHPMGDRFLQAIAERLRSLVREADTVARVGGDEFMLLLPGIGRGEDAVAVCEKIYEALGSPLRIEGHDIDAYVSIGISMYPFDGRDTDTLLRNADAAMYRAKKLGNSYQLFTPAMNVKAAERLAIENGLNQALRRNEFVVYYQPQVDISTGAVVGTEALIRWQHPERGLVLPADFIPIAEDTGLIVPIGEWVLRTACQQAKAWRESGLPKLRMAVNLSARQFLQPDLAGTVGRVLEESGLEPSCLELEVTETVAMENASLGAAVLRALERMGVRLTIDDFGTGYSSLIYLKDFPVHSLKIDRSFVEHVSEDASDAAIVGASIALAHSLGLGVVAEGVETVKQLDFLREHGCDHGQGFLFAKPMPAGDLAKFLHTNRARWSLPARSAESRVPQAARTP
jgi:diguanylate cyclase (GGDEF)-like protein/PAS domain S-box-containing protein